MTSCDTNDGKTLIGEHGSYYLADCIGQGGNGKVYNVIVKEHYDLSLNKDIDYVVKILDVGNKKDSINRIKRFKREIETVTSIQNKVKNIINIIDYNIDKNLNKESSYWYIMPRAKEFDYKKLDKLQILENMLAIGNCIKQLKDLELSHRDIKPNNIMVLNNKVCLSDFGLVIREYEPEEITNPGDRLGPDAIRPPEFEYFEKALRSNLHNYYKSDVYLFAKTIWIMLKGHEINQFGFRGSYDIKLGNIKLTNDNYEYGRTIEPLHELMEKATFHYPDDRIDIERCIELLKIQIAIIKDDYDENKVNVLIWKEKNREINSEFNPNIKTFTDIKNICEILNRITSVSMAHIYEENKKVGVFNLERIDYINDNECCLNCIDVTRMEYKMIVKIGKLLMRDNNYELKTLAYNDVKTSNNVFNKYDARAIIDGIVFVLDEKIDIKFECIQNV